LISLFNLKPDTSELRHYLNLYQKNLIRTDFIQGKEVKELEKALSDYTKIKYVQTCAKVTDALVIALKSLNLKKKTFVITTPFSWISTVNSIYNVGLIPLFVDIDPQTYNLDFNEIKKALIKYKSKVSCILSVDLFGCPNDNREIYKLCKLYKTKFLIDGAQSFGSKIDNIFSFKFCDIATSSFFPTKPLGCFGDGGAIFTNKKKYYSLIKSLCFNGKNQIGFDKVGYNSRLDTIQASVLQKKLSKFENNLNLRKKNIKIYKKNIKTNLKFQKIKKNYDSVFAVLSLLAPNSAKKNLILKNIKNKIDCKIYYPKIFTDYKYIKKNSKSFSNLVNAKKISRKIFSLPLHSNLKDFEIKKICNEINKILK